MGPATGTFLTDSILKSLGYKNDNDFIPRWTKAGIEGALWFLFNRYRRGVEFTVYSLAGPGIRPGTNPLIYTLEDLELAYKGDLDWQLDKIARGSAVLTSDEAIELPVLESQE